jgi:competence protein ComFB
MDIHNTSEDVVCKVVDMIFEDTEKRKNPDGFCLCDQCRVDTICFVLNRVEPHYIVSNRGSTRIDFTGVKRQQTEADIMSLALKGFKLVNHNLRPTSHHDKEVIYSTPPINSTIFDIPTITGRIFDGISFEPVVGIDVSLYCDGELVPMRNNNWQNPYTINSSTPGAYSFWPMPVITDGADIKQEFKYAIKVTSADFEVLNHFFNIESVSKYHAPHSYALNRTYKLPDLYLFPPGEAEQNENQK